VHARALASTFVLQIAHPGGADRARACPHLLGPTYPSRTRGTLSVLKTHDGTECGLIRLRSNRGVPNRGGERWDSTRDLPRDRPLELSASLRAKAIAARGRPFARGLAGIAGRRRELPAPSGGTCAGSSHRILLRGLRSSAFTSAACDDSSVAATVLIIDDHAGSGLSSKWELTGLRLTGPTGG
jgi:hypothetical protein